MSDILDPVILDRYLAGTATPAELEVVKRWVAADSEREERLAGLGQILAPHGRLNQAQSKRWLQAIVAPSNQGRMGASLPGIRASFRYLSIAAAIVIGVFGIKYLPNIINTKQSVPSTKTYTTTPGQRATITLASGTTAVLGPATTLTVSESTVQLSGEAMFSVVHRNTSPFIIQAGNTTIRVLGTTFGVRKYDSDKEVRVAVAEGKVMVHQSVLSSGDVAVGNNGQINVTHDAERALAWLAFANGKLVVDWQTLAGASPEISRWLNMDVHVDASVASRRFSTALQYESPTAALDEIATLTKTRYTRNGSIVVFTER